MNRRAGNIVVVGLVAASRLAVPRRCCVGQGAGRAAEACPPAKVVGRRAGRVLSPTPATKLVGTRPDYEQAAAVAASNAPNRQRRRPSDAAAAGSGWSKLIDAETIETEIKRLAQDVGERRDDAERNSKAAATRIVAATSACWPCCSPSPPNTTATSAGRIRRPRLRDLFARAGHNCKVGTDQTFQEATQRKQDLADLIAGTGRKLPQAERESRLGAGRRSPAADAAA